MSVSRADALVFFGATGDLACKKIFPSLQATLKRGNLDVPAIGEGHFSRGDAGMFQALLGNLQDHDPFLVCADCADYLACRDRVSDAWADSARWTRMSILNVARAGKFSSNRSLREYCDTIWGARAVPIRLKR